MESNKKIDKGFKIGDIVKSKESEVGFTHNIEAGAFYIVIGFKSMYKYLILHTHPGSSGWEQDRFDYIGKVSRLERIVYDIE